MLGLHKDEVKLHPYNPNWVVEYEKEKSILQKILKHLALDIQHVGSTSIPGLSAKPIIDIAVAVQSTNNLLKTIPILEKAGYDLLIQIDTKGEVLARKGSENCRTHYIHIEVINSEYWNNHILFRDYLLKHPHYIKEYEDLKIAIKDKCSDRKEYTSQKHEFINNIINLAKIEFNKN